jgi:hypothetical protein
MLLGWLEEGYSISEKFIITVAPMKEVYSSFRGISTWQIGFESRARAHVVMKEKDNRL